MKNVQLILHQLTEKLASYNLTPEVLFGRLDNFSQNVVNIIFKLKETTGCHGVVVLEFGLVEPTRPPKIENVPPLPSDVLELIDKLKGIPSHELKEVLHEEVLVVQPRGKRKIYHASIPSDFMDSTYPPSNFRSRIILNTIIYNKIMSDRALEDGVSKFRQTHYPKIDVQKLPKKAIVDSTNINQDLIDIPKRKEAQIFDFKGFQTCLFVYALACYYINLIEGRWADEDELLELTQSLITLAEQREFLLEKGNSKRERAKEYLRKRSRVERMVRKHLGKLVRMGVLQKSENLGRNVYAISALSFGDKFGRTLWLPSATLLKKIREENIKIWNCLPSLDIDKVPGRPQDRVFVGGSTSYLPTLRVIESICISNGKQPVLTYDFKISGDKTYKECIRLLLDCSCAIFEISEGAGQFLEIQKALEFGMPTLLLKRSDKQISQMLLTLVRDKRNAYVDSYDNFEEMRDKINKFLQTHCSYTGEQILKV
jgi:hypothetical protein